MGAWARSVRDFAVNSTLEMGDIMTSTPDFAYLGVVRVPALRTVTSCASLFDCLQRDNLSIE